MPAARPRRTPPLARLARLAVVALATSLALAPAARAQAPGAQAPVAPGGARTVRTVDLAPDCPACRDFFTYANGGWVQRTAIPAAYPSWDGFTEVYERNLAALHRILGGLRTGPAAGRSADDEKIAAYYATCMDSAAADRAGAAPLAPMLRAIDSAGSSADVVRLVARLQAVGVAAGFNASPEIDPKESGRVIGELAQGGLGLPDRDYYTKTDAESDSLRRAYVEHVGRMLALGGMSQADAAAAADRVMRLETGLAAASMTIVEQRDPYAVYHKLTVRELAERAPGVDWPGYFHALGVGDLANAGASLDVSQPEFFRHFAAALRDTPVADWRTYLRWQLLHATAPMLGGRFFDEDFRFQRRLTGVTEPQARWKRCVARTDAGLGEALGRLYVAREFTPAAKARMLELVGNLEAAFRERIAALDWMSPATKARAQAKLAAFTRKIAYPDRWRDYSALRVSADAPFVTNALAAAAFEERRQLAKVGRPTDRTEWGMTPPTVNAYYNPLNNEIVFPAGILMPPFFDPGAEDAVNYGGIGMVIGHEMTHGFDDQGRQYDLTGNLRDWWTADDARGFTSRAANVARQYGAYAPAAGLRINGEQTLGENLADIGGLTLAYYAYERSLAGKPRAVVDGFTPEQRFFLGFAQAWHAKYRPEALRLAVATDVHSPDPWRVNGAVSAMPEFAAAFGCRAGDAMVRGKAASDRIW